MGPPTPDPRKVPKKVQKVKKKVDFDYFSRTFFGTFRGSGVGGSQTPLGRLFETFRGFGFWGSVDGGRDPKSGNLFGRTCCEDGMLSGP